MDHDAWRAQVDGLDLPAAFVDLDAVDANAALLLDALVPGPRLRVASKSIRCVSLLRHLVEAAGPRAGGLMTFSARETAWLAEQGFDDLLLAYPVSRAPDALALVGAARQATVRVMVDDLAQVDVLSAAAVSAGITLALCIDVDASLRWLGGRVHLGVRRSPVRTGAMAVALARHIASTPGVRLDGVMSYEAQVAGMPDRSARLDPTDVVKRWIKRTSVPVVAARRAEVLAALAADGHAITVVNGGGTGSVRSTSRDPAVTEVTAGSGFLCPHLFDGYDGLPLRPALFFVLPVVRSSDAGLVTCLGGGYVASGAAGPDRLPRVHLPAGLAPLGLEGFGEVQTPFTGAAGLAIGDPVVCRPGKAGELAERFARYHLLRGGRIVDTVDTLRGAGVCFF